MLKRQLYTFVASAALCLTTLVPSVSFAEDASGIVLGTMDAAGYTYIHLDSGMGSEWIAVPKTTIATGEKITYSQGMVMKDFHSKSLDRTFDTIIFSAGIQTDSQPAAAALPAAAAATEDSFAAAVAREQQTPDPATPVFAETSGGSTGAVVPFSEVSVEKASGENSYTVEELFAKAKALDGQTVRLRGKVVKVSANIMGRNWIHLQDGTGNPMSNTHDLVVTTADTVANNSIVTMEGVLSADKDFGAGYKYDAIIESAVTIQ